jgi:ABC-type transport system involved in multi-copper enzyme maturation permease subunit
MMKIKAIAINTFREAIRDNILYSLLFFALLMMGASVLLGTLTIGEQLKIVKDMGLAAISIFGTLIAIFVGIGLVYKEIDRRTIYTIIAKPVPRHRFLLGKYLGLILTLVIEVTVMSIVFLLLIFMLEHSLELYLLKAVLLIFFELMIVTAVAILFSTFSTPTLSGMFTLAIYIIGHLTMDLKTLGAKSQSLLLKMVTAFFYYLFPNLENFNIKGKVAHQIPISWEYIFFSMGYGILYVVIILLVSMVIFQRRDFK